MTATAKAVPQEVAREIPEPNRVRALLRLNFSRDPASEATFLSESYQEPPLKVVRAFSLPDGTSLAHLHNVSGGLLGGDQFTQQINVGSNAQVLLTTTGATRVYRHRAEYPPTTQHTEIAVGKGALLEYLPDATIPFAGARYLQHTSIHLAENSGLFWWEILAPGREARGELFTYDQFEVRTRITALDRIIAAENLLLRPATHKVSSLARLGAYRYIANFYVCRVGLDTSAWPTAEERLRGITSGMTHSGEILWGVSSLVAHGLLVRCLARSGREIVTGLQTIWRASKRHLYNLDAIPPRKVN
jgi:urease accessory protein